MRTLLTGLDNPDGLDPRSALSPIPSDGPGARIVDLIRERVDGYDSAAYLRDFSRTNLYPARRAPQGKGSRGEDHNAFAQLLWYCDALEVENVVLLGSRVLAAHNALFDASLDWLQSRTCAVPMVRFWALPLPAVNNRWYDDPKNRTGAARLLADLRRRRVIPYAEA